MWLWKERFEVNYKTIEHKTEIYTQNRSEKGSAQKYGDADSEN